MTVTLISMIKRRADLSRQEFIDYYENHHALFGIRHAKHMCAYRRHYVATEAVYSVDYGDAPFDYDVITESVFPDGAAMMADLTHCAAPEIAAQFVKDESKFIDRSKTRIMTVETRDSMLGRSRSDADIRAQIDAAVSAIVAQDWEALRAFLHPDMAVRAGATSSHRAETCNVRDWPSFLGMSVQQFRIQHIVCPFVIGPSEDSRFAVMFRLSGVSTENGDGCCVDVFQMWEVVDGLIVNIGSFS